MKFIRCKNASNTTKIPKIQYTGEELSKDSLPEGVYRCTLMGTGRYVKIKHIPPLFVGFQSGTIQLGAPDKNKMFFRTDETLVLDITE